MSFKFRFGFAAFISLFIISCSNAPCATKGQFLNSFSSFVEDAKKSADTDTKEQRLVLEDEYKDMVNNCYKKHRASLTLKERQDFWKNSVIFYFSGGRKSLDFEIGTQNNEDFNNYVQEELESVINDSGDDFERIIQEVITENVMPALNDIFKGIENLGKDLQKAIKQE